MQAIKESFHYLRHQISGSVTNRVGILQFVIKTILPTLFVTEPKTSVSENYHFTFTPAITIKPGWRTLPRS